MYEYNAKLVRVIDGDTIDVNIDFGFDTWCKKRLRIANIDTEELRDKDPLRRARAIEAKLFVMELLSGRELRVVTSKTKAGKDRQTFGRYVAHVTVVGDGMGLATLDLAEMLRQNRLEKQK